MIIFKKNLYDEISEFFIHIKNRSSYWISCNL